MSSPSPPLPDFPATSPPSPPATTDLHRHHSPFLLPPLLAGTIALAFLVFFAVLYRKLSSKRTAPADLSKTPQRFSYSTLRCATSSFAASNRLGQGGFGSVYKGTLDSGLEIAVKLMDASGSLQGEREFHNELSIAARIDTMCCPYIVSILGFSSDQRSRCRRRLSLVYEYMQNGSLQDALLHRKCPELFDWKVRFGIIVDIAKGIEYLHCSCDPPIVHGDIKPSNILLDSKFNAKIADFGLAKVLVRDGIDETFIECGEDVETIDDKGKRRDGNVEDNVSIIEETESLSVMTEEVVVNVDQSPESCVRIFNGEAMVSPEMGSVGVEATPSSVSESCFDRFSVDSANNNRKVVRKKSGSGRDWWWKQDNAGEESESGRVKDYVMEWIGSEIKKERPKKDWIAESTKMEQKKHGNKTLEWWASLDEERIQKERKKNRKPREWWREEFCDELSKKRKNKKKKKRGLSLGSGCSGEMWWQRDDNEELGQERKKRKNRGSRGSIDWWIDGFSSEFRSGGRNSQDYAGGEIPKSGGISSTPSMRGTVCYIAPEYSGGGLLSEKCDVYSFGVLLLVLISGRRPLQVTASPMSEFERANLISWARQLAHNGKLLDLVDTNIQCLNSEQVLLCIKIALLCLQRSPSKRPTIKEIVGMLSGEADAPQLPFEFSPSPPSNFPFKSRKKAR